MRLTECNNVSVQYGSFLLTLKRSDQVPEAISHLPAVDDTSDSILDSA